MSVVKTNRIEQVSSTDLPVNLLSVTASAWAEFDGTGLITIRDSHNVSSITDSGSGIYILNFTSNMTSANYATALASDSINNNIGTRTPSSFTVVTRNSTGAPADTSNISVIVVGGQS